MTVTDGSPRIGPLPVEERDATTVALLARATRGVQREVNIYSTFVRHPRLFGPWLTLAHTLLFEGEVPARERELVILRVARRCGCEYEWAQHRRFAEAAGLDEGEVAAVADGPASARWSPPDRALLTAVDELHDTHTISDATWDALVARWGERVLMEIVVLAGTYALTAGMLNAFGVRPDTGLRGFDGREPNPTEEASS